MSDVPQSTPLTRREIINNLRCLSGPWEPTYRSAADMLASDGAEIERLRAALAWVDQVYQATLPEGGARVEMTWEEYNAMREAIGLPPRKQIGMQPRPSIESAICEDCCQRPCAPDLTVCQTCWEEGAELQRKIEHYGDPHVE